MKLKLFSSFLFLYLIGAIVSCTNADQTSQKNDDAMKKEKHSSHHSKDCKDVHWTYHNDETGPENWHQLCEGFAACAGNAQSPVDINTREVVKSDELQPPKIEYGETPVEIINNGHTVQFNVKGDHYATLNGKKYKLVQFHFHSPSEHTVDGKYFPLEAHFVHKNDDGTLAVLGVMFREGKANPFFEKYLEKLPAEKDTKVADNETYNPQELLPENPAYYRYKGSLTTPPCSEIVDWYVFAEPLEASQEQLEYWSKILHNNNRPVQPLNDRKIYLFE